MAKNIFKELLVLILIVSLLSLLPLEKFLMNLGISFQTALMLVFVINAFIAIYITSHIFSRKTELQPHFQTIPDSWFETVSSLLAKELILKDFRYPSDMRKSIATELQKNTLVARWNRITHELCILSASSEPDQNLTTLIESFYHQQERIIFHGY